MPQKLLSKPIRGFHNFICAVKNAQSSSSKCYGKTEANKLVCQELAKLAVSILRPTEDISHMKIKKKLIQKWHKIGGGFIFCDAFRTCRFCWYSGDVCKQTSSIKKGNIQKKD